MKRTLLFIIFLFSLAAKSQNLMVQSGASVIASGTPTIVLNNMGLDAAPNTADLQNANLVVSGNVNALLKNASAFINLQKLTVDKPGAVLAIANDVQVYKGVQMVNGLFDLSGKNLYLSSNAVITGETEATRITGTSGGFIQTVVNLSNSNNFNPGNMGVYVTVPGNAGLVTVVRGHKAQTGTGLSTAVNRYYEFNPPNTGLNAALRFTYFDAELNGQNENGLQLLESTNGGTSWVNKQIATKDAAANFVTVNGLNSLYRYTLGAPAGAPLPVMGFEFFARRVNARQVQLDWKTVQEINSKGFGVERKCEDEPAFVLKNFVATKAAGGNSATSLNYALIDTNVYNGKTAYRIRQTDVNGSFVYSTIRMVDGTAKTASLTVWPVPAVGTVNVSVQGVSRDELQVWNTAGQLVKRLPVPGAQTLVVNGLAAGTYFIRLRSDPEATQKIVMQ